MNQLASKNYKTKLKYNLKASKALIKLFHASFCNSIAGPFMAFAFPVFFIGLFGNVMSAMGGPKEIALKSALVGSIAMFMMSFAINSVPQWISGFKNSVLFKRIGSTPITPFMFLLVLMSYAAIVMIVQFMWSLMWICIWFPTSVNYILGTGSGAATSIQWGGFIFAIVYTILVSLFIALLLVSVTRTALGAQVLGMLIFFTSMFTSGQMFSITMIVGSPTLNIISYISPFRYTTGLLATSWGGHNIFDVSQAIKLLNYKGVPVVAYHVYDQYLNFFVPIALIGLSLFISIKNFKWSNR